MIKGKYNNLCIYYYKHIQIENVGFKNFTFHYQLVLKSLETKYMMSQKSSLINNEYCLYLISKCECIKNSAVFRELDGLLNNHQNNKTST